MDPDVAGMLDAAERFLSQALDELAVARDEVGMDDHRAALSQLAGLQSRIAHAATEVQRAIDRLTAAPGPPS